MSSYNTPIVAQDGTVCGKLMMELVRTAGEMARHQEEEEEEESSSESSVEETELTEPPGQLSFRLRLMSASGLPPALAHFVRWADTLTVLRDTKVFYDVFLSPLLSSARYLSSTHTPQAGCDDS